MFFVFDGENYTDGYETAEAAKAAAEAAIDMWRDACDPEWPEEVSNVTWGKVLGFARDVEIEERFVRFELCDLDHEFRCNMCGGLVRVDGTKPGKTGV